jgi:hypothetical protein
MPNGASARRFAYVPGDYAGNFPQEYEAYNTQYAGQLESIGWQWWDTQTYTSGTTVQLINYFATQRATVDLSNMEVAGQLAAPKAFLIRAIRFFVKNRPRTSSAAAAAGNQTGIFDDVAQLINTGVFTFTIGNKQYSMNPLWCLTAGGGAAGVLSTSVTGGAVNVTDYAQNGISDPRAVYTLSKPLFIPPQMNFNARVDWAAALTLAAGNTALTFLLDGDLLRPVQ